MLFSSFCVKTLVTSKPVDKGSHSIASYQLHPFFYGAACLRMISSCGAGGHEPFCLSQSSADLLPKYQTYLSYIYLGRYNLLVEIIRNFILGRLGLSLFFSHSFSKSGAQTHNFSIMRLTIEPFHLKLSFKYHSWQSG